MARQGKWWASIVVTLLAVVAIAATILAAQGILGSSVDKPTATPHAFGEVVQGRVQELVSGSVSFASAENSVLTPPVLVADSIPVISARSDRGGSAVKNGQRVVEVSGRPVFVIKGNTPFWRTMAFGMVGRDVQELQSALGSLGFRTTDPRGTFGLTTGDAVRKFYQQHGYKMLNSSFESASPDTDVRELVVPRGEIQPIAGLPARLSDFCALTATDPTSLCEVRSNQVTAIMSIPTASAAQLAVGRTVSVTPPGDKTMQATIESKVRAPAPVQGDSAADVQESASVVKFVIQLQKDEDLHRLIGQTAAAQVVIRQSLPTAILVPESGLFGSSGDYFIKVVSSRRPLETASVPVSVGLCAQGRCSLLDPSSRIAVGAELLLDAGVQ